jgi:hypothetical protein
MVYLNEKSQYLLFTLLEHIKALYLGHETKSSGKTSVKLSQTIHFYNLLDTPISG